MTAPVSLSSEATEGNTCTTPEALYLPVWCAPSSDVGVKVEMPSLGRVARTYSMGWKLDEADGLVLTVAMPESSCMPERGEADQEPGSRPQAPGPCANQFGESAQVRTRHPEALSPYTKSATHLCPFPVNTRHASTVCYHAC